MDRQSVLHAERERRRVHHTESSLDRLEVGQRGQERCVGVGARVAVVDTLRGVLAHQDRLRPDLERPQRRGRVGREERIAGAGGEDHDPALFEVAHRAASNVRLRDLRDLERREHTSVGADALECVLERECVQDGREHAGVIRRGAVHPFRRCSHTAVDVAPSDDDRQLEAFGLNFDDLPGERVDSLRIYAVLVVAHQRLS